MAGLRRYGGARQPIGLSSAERLARALTSASAERPRFDPSRIALARALTPTPPRRPIGFFQSLAREEAWHSVRQDVYHNNRACTEGNNIERRYLLAGSGGKRLCRRCESLNGLVSALSD